MSTKTRLNNPPHAQTARPASGFSLEERLKHGFLTVNEGCALAACGRSSLYKDARLGRLALTKTGRRTRIYGPEMVRYLDAKSGE